MRKTTKGGIGGGGAGLLLVWLLGLRGVDLGAEEGATIALGVSAVGAFVWHHGIANIGRQLWRGDRR